ncbi:MAG TPA: AraC family transcriptional regulator [Caldimonas sp.]|nr:AraC family transcriptional regulator [Caldimonas sp.]
MACMSSYHFLRYFSLLHGVTPHAYVVRCRSAAARRMLADGITDATVVARRSGFGSRSSLYRALRGKVRAGMGG